MTEQGELFRTRRQRREAGTTAALGRHAVAYIRDVIDELARSGQPFSANDVRAKLPAGIVAQLEGASGSLGAALQAQARAGAIREVGWTRTQTEKGNLRRIILWRGTM